MNAPLVQLTVALYKPARNDSDGFNVSEGTKARLSEPAPCGVHSGPIAQLHTAAPALDFFKRVNAERHPERRRADSRPQLLGISLVEVPAILPLDQIGSPCHGFTSLICDRLMCHWPQKP